MMWAGGNPNFDIRTGESIPEDSPMWRDPETGEYVNRTSSTPYNPPAQVIQPYLKQAGSADGSTQGMPNLGYAQQQISGAQPAGLEKQNLDYAMSQLGMMSGGSGGGSNYNESAVSIPGWNAPMGGASSDGSYSNPFTGSDSAGRSQDDPYYGGDSDFGTYGGGGLSSDYGLSNSWSQWGREAAGMLPGMWGTAGQMFGDAAMGLNPMPGAGNYIPGTDTYMQDYNVNYEGPGDVTTDMYGLGVSEQRDMLIDQGRMGEGMLFGKSVDADQQFFGSQQEALNWMNNDVNVADPTGQFAAEAVSVANDFTPVQDSSFGSQAEAQAVANHGFGSDEHMAALEADGNQPAIDALKSPTAPGVPVPTAPVPAPDTGSSDGGWGDTDTSEGSLAGDYKDAGFSKEEMDFATSLDTPSDSGSSDGSSSDDGGYGDDSDDGGEGWGSEDATDDNAGSSDSGGGDSGGGGGGSYIATAATQALGEEGLTIFEEWRDYMFEALPTFTTSYGRYRVTAPKIVAAIDKKEDSKEIYSWIWDTHLKPIFSLITADKDSTKALKDYKTMVKELTTKFLKEKA